MNDKPPADSHNNKIGLFHVITKKLRLINIWLQTLILIGTIIGAIWLKRKVDTFYPLIQSLSQQQSLNQKIEQKVDPSLSQNVNIQTDTNKVSFSDDRPVVVDSFVPCNSRISFPTSHGAEFKIECFVGNYDSVKATVRFKMREYSHILQKNQEALFEDSFSYSPRWIYVQLKDFTVSDLP